jgi:glyoxylase-like metal-dependent hydrolase (beta-lactamase superfamily II)
VSAGEGASQRGSPHDPHTALLAERGIACVLAPNPGMLTLSGTNTWIVARDPAWVVDPGPSSQEHLARVCEAVDERGGLGGVALTHGHADHSELAAPLAERYGVPLAAAAPGAEVALSDGSRFGPFEVVATPGHAPDHVALLANDACFSGDAVLGQGSVFVAPYGGSMSAYLAALARLGERSDFTVICPGHGPTVPDGHAKLREYREHRLARERALVEALEQGRRTTAELLDAAWADVPRELRPAAAVTLAAHLDKLEEEQQLPSGVERPPIDEAQLRSVHW